MAEALIVNINKKFKNIDIIDDSSLQIELDQMNLRKESLQDQKVEIAQQQKNAVKDLEEQKDQLANVANTIAGAISQMDTIHKYAIAQHKQEIVRLSIEIAKKIMLRQISEGDYNVADIIEKTLERTPDRRNILIYVSPGDYEFCSNFIKENPSHPIATLNINSSPTIPNGQCKVETSKGIIEYYIDEHLARIEDALGVTQ